MSEPIKYPISKHIFMFPFIINEDTNKIIKKLSPDWIPDDSCESKVDSNLTEFQNQIKFNEVNYFYPFVQKLLFPSNNKCLLTKYYWNFRKGKFNFSILEKKDKQDIEKEYILNIPEKGIELILLKNFSIGVLIFHLENWIEKSFDAILKINDYARRIYPQFLPLVSGEYGGSQRAFLPKKISLILDEKPVAKEDFSYYADLKKIKEIKYASYIMHFLNDLNFEHVLDDRMFVVSYTINNIDGEKILSSYPLYSNSSIQQIEKTTVTGNETRKEELVSYQFNASSFFEQNNNIDMQAIDTWYKYCFVDGNDATCQSDSMKHKLLMKCTYDRWNKWGTLWGVTRYSLVALFTEGVPAYLQDHVSYQYKDLALMWLINRAILLKFAKESSSLANCITRINRLTNKEIKIITSLRENYISFINDIWFTEVTSQEQGIELYQMGMKQMELFKQKEELRKDIEELFNYVSSYNQRMESKSIDKLTILGAFFLPLTLMVGILSVNNIFFSSTYLLSYNAWLLLLLPTSILMCLIIYIKVKKPRFWRWLTLPISILSVIIVFKVIPFMKIAKWLIELVSKFF